MNREQAGGYVLFPRVEVDCPDARVYEGFGAIAPALAAAAGPGKAVVSVECYPGVDQQELLDGLAALRRGETRRKRRQDGDNGPP